MSIKLEIGWTDSNVIIEGVRIYKKQQAFDVSTRPQPLVEVTDGSLFYEDLDVIENQTYFYMLSCFLGEQEVFTECFEVVAELPSPYTGIYIVATEGDASTASLLSDALAALGVEIYSKTFSQITTIPSDAKLIIAPFLDGTKASVTSNLTNLKSKFDAGIPLILIAAGGTATSSALTFTNQVGISERFTDVSSTNSIDIVNNTVLTPPFNSDQTAVIVRESSYYMAGISTPASNAKVFAKKGSIAVGVFLEKGALNRNGLPSPANIACAGFAWTRTAQLLNSSGKELFKQLVVKTMR